MKTLTATETMSDRLIPLLDAAADAAETLGAAATKTVKAKIAPDGKIDNAVLEREQHVAHGLAWIATYVEGIRQMADYAKRTGEEGRFGEFDGLLTQIVVGEYLAQLAGGVVMSQGEVVRLHELGVAIALDDLGAGLGRFQAQPLHGLGLQFRIEVGDGPHGA